MRIGITPALCALALIILLAQAGCGGSSSTTGDSLAGGQTASRGALPALPQLPDPAGLLTPRSSSAVTLSLDGADFDATLPSRGITVDGTNALFAPTDFGVNPPVFSFAVYRFNLEGLQPGSLEIFSGFTLDTSPILGLADWSANRWDWSTLSGGDTIGADNIAPDGTVLVAVVTYNGALGYELQRLSFAAYDEVEDNDTPATANTLPGANFSGFRGNAGNYDEIPGYDGDGEDWFTLTDTFAAGQSLDLTVFYQVGEFSIAEGDVDLEVYSTADVLLKTGNPGIYSTAAKLVFGTDFQDADLPLKLRIFCDPQERFKGGDYRITSRSGFAPTAVLDVDKFVEDLPANLILDASASTDPDGDIVSYEWDYAGPGDIEADDIITTLPQLEVEWSEPGAYTVYLTVRDSKNYVSFASDVILLGPNPFDEIEPNDTAQPLDPLKNGGWKGNTGSDDTVAVVYDGSADYFSIAVPVGQSARFAIETTDGSGASIEALYYFSPDKIQGFPLYCDRAYQLKNNSLSEQTFYVQVGEGFSGASGGDYTLTWGEGIEPTAPTIVADVAEGSAPLTVNFSATDLNDPDGSIVRYEWDFQDDGLVDSTEATPSFTYTETGNQIVRVVVYDDDELRNGAGKLIKVN